MNAIAVKPSNSAKVLNVLIEFIANEYKKLEPVVSEVITLPVLPKNLITNRTKRITAGKNATILAKTGADFFIKKRIVNQTPTTNITKNTPSSKTSVNVEPKNLNNRPYLAKIEMVLIKAMRFVSQNKPEATVTPIASILVKMQIVTARQAKKLTVFPRLKIDLRKFASIIWIGWSWKRLSINDDKYGAKAKYKKDKAVIIAQGLSLNFVFAILILLIKILKYYTIFVVMCQLKTRKRWFPTAFNLIFWQILKHVKLQALK